MNKSCARCNKIVYPIEELKCLDKTWHKTCFKCHECGMTLNMKTYKGFSKLPYCEAHIPKAKATAIADTPELKRIAENTKIQSNVQYHADFEKQKGKLTQVADDPETLRIKQNTKHISNVAYHGDLEKKAAMEKQREVAEVADNRDNESEYFSETLAAESLSQYQPLPPSQTQHTQQQQIAQQHSSLNQNSQIYPSQNSQPQKQAQQYAQQNYKAQPPLQQQQQQANNHHNTNYQSHNFAPDKYTNIRSSVVQSAVNPSGGVNQQQNSQQKYYDQYENYARPTAQNVPIYNNNNSTVYGNQQQEYAYPYQHQQPPSNIAYNNAAGYNNHYNQLQYGNESGGGGGGGIGKISDYDPLTDGPRNVPNATRPSSTLIFSSDRGMVSNNLPRRIGSVADIDPANGIYGSIEHNNTQNQYHQQQQQQLQHIQNQARQAPIQQQQQQSYSHAPQQVSKPTVPLSSKVRAFRALYDYEAQDSDEVSFSEGDIIFEVDSIDEGWMTGRVERTGKTGMLPANYVKPATI